MKDLNDYERKDICGKFKLWLIDFLISFKGRRQNERFCEDYIRDCCNYIHQHPELLPLPPISTNKDGEKMLNFNDDYYNDEECNFMHKVIFVISPYKSINSYSSRTVWECFLEFWEEEWKKADKQCQENNDYKESPFLLYKDQIGSKEFRNKMIEPIWKAIDFFDAWEGTSCNVTESISCYVRNELQERFECFKSK